MTSTTTRTEQVSGSQKQRTKNKKQRGTQQSLAESELVRGTIHKCDLIQATD